MEQQKLKLIRFKGLVDLGIIGNRVTLQRWIHSGRFPKPIRIGPNSVAWRWDSVQQWLDAREAETNFPNEAA